MSIHVLCVCAIERNVSATNALAPVNPSHQDVESRGDDPGLGDERMNAQIDRRIKEFTGLRVLLDTPMEFAAVCDRLRVLVGRATIADLVALAHDPIDEDEFARRLNERYVGPSGFMLFAEINHGGWISKFGINRRTLRLILGNPLIAITMLRHDLIAGLFAPVEVLVTEHEDKQGTNVVYVQPSSLIVVEYNPSLQSAAEALDTKLADLIAAAVCP
jgi:uncharacterized protein (DUF302 family)